MLSPELEERLKAIEQRYLELQYQLSSPEVVSDREKLTRLGKELKELEEVYTAYRNYKKLLSDLEQARELLKSEDLRELAREEVERLTEELEKVEKNIRILLLPKDPRDSRNVILEIRAGVGGEEAALFVADLLNMYQKYAEEKGWKFSILSTNRTGLG
ncbi:MAG: PCRF domain-containing protein, partial [Aquificota bacterium]